jgi:hypothetical protein
VEEKMKPEEFLDGGTVKVWKEEFVVLKSRQRYSEALANIDDGDELTVIIDQEDYSEKDVLEKEGNWKILTFDMDLPFELVGFLAEVAQVLADEGISIFAISAYSTDHILVKKPDLEDATEKLENLGCNIKWKN